MPCRAMHEVTRPAAEQSKARARSSADKAEGPNACSGRCCRIARSLLGLCGGRFLGVHAGCTGVLPLIVDCLLEYVLAVR